MNTSRKRRRFLLVEDEPLIGMILEDYLSELGHDVACQVDNVRDALALAATATDLDGAILDVNIKGGASHPIAAALKVRGIPFCVMTGSGAAWDASYGDAPVISKPFDMCVVQQAIDGLADR